VTWDVRRSITLFISVKCLEKSLVWFVIMVPYFVQCISEQLKWDAGVTAGRRRGGGVCPPGACPSHPGRSN
jgi:hypothetical protein